MNECHMGWVSSFRGGFFFGFGHTQTMLARQALINVPRRALAVRFYSEGATGAARSDGSSDSFTKREKAQEDFYVKKHQAEQIAALKEQLAKQKAQLDELEKNSK